MATSCLALLLASAALLVFERTTWRSALVREVSVLTQMAGDNAASALAFLDADTARSILASLGANQHIVAACVYDKGNQVFATYERPEPGHKFVPPSPSGVSHQFRDNRLGVFKRIVLANEPIGTIYVETDLGGLRERLMQYAAVIFIVIVVVSFVAFLIADKLQRAVFAPFFMLAAVAKEIAQQNNYALRATKQNDDELGTVIDGFNNMLAQIQIRDGALQKAHNDLEKRVQERTLDLLASNERLKSEITERQQAEERLALANRELVETSRFAGMAEVATGVLHNVGNVLNSVNVSATLVSDQLRRSKLANFSKVCALIEEHKEQFARFIENDRRGQRLPNYLQSLAGHLAQEHRDMLREIDLLRKNIEHIKDIVSMQQTYAKVSGIIETVSVSELIEDALRMNGGALIRHEIHVTRDLEPGLDISVEKHKVLQILVNLIRNAKYACDEGSPDKKEIIIRSASVGAFVHISVIDNGIGIPPENLTKIFGHGFTTKKRGHGFGLHSGALAADEMGGALTAYSEGLNRGAKFVLELPFTARVNKVDSVATNNIPIPLF